MKKIVLYIWQLPQNLLGLALIIILKAQKRIFKVEHGFIEWHYFERNNRFSKLFSGSSLGNYILLPYERENTIKHEYGHQIQSQRWGLLYLLVIGLPSLINNLRGRTLYKNWTQEQIENDYYSRYPEKQADELGGVERWTNL